jgi:hypothetical protein
MACASPPLTVLSNFPAQFLLQSKFLSSLEYVPMFAYEYLASANDCI